MRGSSRGDDRILEETAIPNFCHLLERHGLTRASFAAVNARLADKGNVSAEREAAFMAPGKVWAVMRKAPKGSPLHPLDERINRITEPRKEPCPTLHVVRAMSLTLNSRMADGRWQMTI